VGDELNLIGYHRAMAGANPRLALLYEPILGAYFPDGPEALPVGS